MSARRTVLPILVAIIGGSGSGKSWLAERLAAAFGHRATRLSLDDFYRDQSHLPLGRRARINFDHPRSIDWPAFQKTIENLSLGRQARIPIYDFATHARLPGSRTLKPKRVILVDGLWLLRRRALRHAFALSIFLDCPAQLRFRRRLARDLQARGRSAASIRCQFHATVEPMHRRHVAPQAARADVVLKLPGTKELSEVAFQIRRLAGLS